MNSLFDRVAERLERLRADIVAAIEREGETASGRTQRSLMVVQDEKGVRLVAAAGERAPLNTLEIGRKGGKVPKGFYLILRQWSIDKGLTFASDRERNTFAYLLGRRIAREGTLRDAQHVDIYSSLTEQAAREISGMLGASVKEQIKSNI